MMRDNGGVTKHSGVSIPITWEVLDDVRSTKPDFASLMADAVYDATHPDHRRHGPPAPRQQWVIDSDGYLADLNPADLLAEAKRLHAALADIANPNDAEDYYVGDVVTAACSAIGHRETVPG